MKNITTLFLNIIVFFSFYFGFSQKTIYWDEAGKNISTETFHKKWKTPKYARWNHINKNGQKISQLVSPEYKSLQINYSNFLSAVEQNTHRVFDDQTVFVIGYYFFEDLCRDEPNQWDKKRVRKRKKFIASWKKTIEDKYPNTVFFVFFDQRIFLENKPFSKKEYFFKDQNNWLGKTLFTAPALCGSFTIIKPDGNAMVKNGEYSVGEIQKWLNAATQKK